MIIALHFKANHGTNRQEIPLAREFRTSEIP